MSNKKFIIIQISYLHKDMVESANQQLAVKSQGGQWKLVEEAAPAPGKGQALIRVHYSTVNPYDRICFKNEKNTENFTLGCDGCGVVESVGDGVDTAAWVGKKVAFLGGGWARYAVKDVDFLVPFRDDFDLKNGANTYVNPFTVTAMLDIAQKNGA
jgi:NADPH:quinone reductase-like Zn-dependent oxidoreductase